MAQLHAQQQTKLQDDAYQSTTSQQQTAAASQPSAKNEQMTQDALDGLVPLEKGSKDKARVLDLQRRLVDLGFSTNGIDGGYGNGTVGAVKAFQVKHGLSVTGKADLTTLQKIYQLAPTPSIGALSAKYESRGGDNSVVAYDSNGGTSYGKYQIAAKVGAMTDFVKWLKNNNYQDLASKLEAAKPYDTGSASGACPKVWKENSAALEKPVEEFIYSTYYTNAIAGKSYKEFIDGSHTLRDAYYSATINHGAGGAHTIVKDVYKAGMSKADFVKKFYDRRKKYVKGNKYEDALCKRYSDECSIALGLLELEDKGLISGSNQLTQNATQAEQTQGSTQSQSQKTEANNAAQNNSNIQTSEPTTAAPSTGHVDINIQVAVSINKSYGYSRDTWKQIQTAVGLTGNDVDGYVGPVTTQAIANWQAQNGLKADGMCGPQTLAAMQKQGHTTVPSEPKVEETPKDVPQENAGDPNVSQDKSFKYFSLAELTYSDTARARGIDNSIPDKATEDNLSALIINCLDPIRETYGGPISVNSGYRCPALNKAVGGVTNSQHKTGEAADISVGSPSKNKALIQLIKKMRKESGFQYDQLIDEYNAQWIHISYKKSGNRNQDLNIT